MAALFLAAAPIFDAFTVPEEFFKALAVEPNAPLADPGERYLIRLDQIVDGSNRHFELFGHLCPGHNLHNLTSK
jgi:hypothetical protein